MKIFLKWLLLAPVAAMVLIFAVANRHTTNVRLDPLGLLSDDMTISAPLFVILFLALMLGVVIGGCATWLAQSKYRRATREALADLRAIREDSRQRAEEVARLRSELAALPAPANDTRSAA